MSTPKNALNVTISAATVLGSGAQPLAGPPITDYQGEHLYCHASISGSTLAITVDQNPRDNLDPAGSVQPAERGALASAVTQAMLTVTYKSRTASWSAPQPVQYNAATLAWSMRLSADFSQVSIHVAEALPPAPPVPGQTEASFGFVLVQDDDTPEAPYRICWIANPIAVPDYQHHTTATVVLPNEHVVGIIGPMGVELDRP